MRKGDTTPNQYCFYASISSGVILGCHILHCKPRPKVVFSVKSKTMQWLVQVLSVDCIASLVWKTWCFSANIRFKADLIWSNLLLLILSVFVIFLHYLAQYCRCRSGRDTCLIWWASSENLSALTDLLGPSRRQRCPTSASPQGGCPEAQAHHHFQASSEGKTCLFWGFCGRKWRSVQLPTGTLALSHP